MSKLRFEFQIKRGVVQRDCVDEDLLELFDRCMELCENGKYEEAVKYILPHIFFEWNWSNCDGNPSSTFETSNDIRFPCNNDNCTLGVGNDKDGCLVITASASFNVESIDKVDSETVQEWIDEKALWSCGYIGAGWAYSGSDGDNVWLISICD